MLLRHSLLCVLSLCTLLLRGQSATIDSLQKIIAENRLDSAQLQLRLKLSDEYSRVNMVQAKRALYTTMLLAHQLKQSKILGSAYAQMVTLQTNTGVPDSAEYYLGLLKELALANPHTDLEDNYYFSAGIFFKKRGEFKTALSYMKESLARQIASGDKTTTAGQTLNIGNTYLQMGDMKNALAYHLQALKLFESLNNKKGQSFCFQGIGDDLVKFDRFREAIPYLQKAIHIKDELGDKRGVATSLIGLAQAYQGVKNYDKGIEYIKQALELTSELKIVPALATANFVMAKLCVDVQDLNGAQEYFNKSKRLALQGNDSSLAATCASEIINLKATAGKQHETEKQLFSNLQVSVESGDRYSEINNYKFLSHFYADSKMYDKALSFNEKFHAKKDSTQNNELELQLKKMEQEYNLEKKEKEIALLKKDQLLRSAELQKERTFKAGALLLTGLLLVIGLLVVNYYRVIQKARRLVEIEKLRNDIARDLHDDIGSALSSININSNMALNRSDDAAVVKTQLERIKINSDKMMDSMGDIVWAIHPANDSMESLLSKMKEFLSEMLEPLDINYHLELTDGIKKMKLSVDKRKEVYLVFKEAVNNAAKYSRCSNVSVILSNNNQFLQLRVTDDGTGFDAQKKAGNGLRNMRQRAVAIGGTLQLNTNYQKGTNIIFQVPVIT